MIISGAIRDGISLSRDELFGQVSRQLEGFQEEVEEITDAL